MLDFREAKLAGIGDVNGCGFRRVAEPAAALLAGDAADRLSCRWWSAIPGCDQGRRLLCRGRCVALIWGATAQEHKAVQGTFVDRDGNELFQDTESTSTIRGVAV